MKGKKLLSVILTLALALSFVTTAFAADFGDTSGHWAEAAIDRWSGYGIVTGDATGFHPDATMTRAQAATVFARLFALGDGSATKTNYPDLTADKWYYEAMNKCINAGIMNGMDGMANGDGEMTREMFFVMFARALGLKEQDTTKGLPADGAAWSRGYINALTDKGFVQGMDGKVNATGKINRASVMTLLDQTISVYANEDGKTYTGTGKGVMLVTANECTVTGDIDMLVIASDTSAASGATAKVNEDGSVSAALVLAAGKANIKIENANVNSVVVTESGVTVTFEGGAVTTIAIPADAEGVEIEVAEGTEVGSIEVEAPNTSISNSGVITSIEVAKTATGAEVTAEAGSYTGVVVTEAAETTVSGSGAVANVVASGDAASGSDAVTVTTAGTKTATTDESGTTTEATTSGTLPAASGENATAAATAATEAATVASEAVTANEGAASDNSGSTTTTTTTPTTTGGSSGGSIDTSSPSSSWVTSSVSSAVTAINGVSGITATLTGSTINIDVTGSSAHTVGGFYDALLGAGVRSLIPAALTTVVIVKDSSASATINGDLLTAVKSGTSSSVTSALGSDSFSEALAGCEAILGLSSGAGASAVWNAQLPDTVTVTFGSGSASNASATYTVNFTGMTPSPSETPN